jgi:hypothetical protein
MVTFSQSAYEVTISLSGNKYCGRSLTPDTIEDYYGTRVFWFFGRINPSSNYIPGLLYIKGEIARQSKDPARRVFFNEILGLLGDRRYLERGRNRRCRLK